MFDFLKGYKTYLVAAAAIVGAVAGFATGELSLTEGIGAIVAAVTAMTMRAGIEKSGTPKE